MLYNIKLLFIFVINIVNIYLFIIDWLLDWFKSCNIVVVLKLVIRSGRPTWTINKPAMIWSNRG